MQIPAHPRCVPLAQSAPAAANGEERAPDAEGTGESTPPPQLETHPNLDSQPRVVARDRMPSPKPCESAPPLATLLALHAQCVAVGGALGRASPASPPRADSQEARPVTADCRAPEQGQGAPPVAHGSSAEEVGRRLAEQLLQREGALVRVPPPRVEQRAQIVRVESCEPRHLRPIHERRIRALGRRHRARSHRAGVGKANSTPAQGRRWRERPRERLGARREDGGGGGSKGRGAHLLALPARPVAQLCSESLDSL